jgi:hypothetical protein
MSRSRGLCCRALGLAAALAASSTAAQEPGAASTTPADAAPAPEREGDRTLAGHVFVPTTLVPGPFATTSFSTQMIIMGGSSMAEIQVGDETFSGAMDFAGIGAFAQYEYSFLDHFSVRAWLDDLIFSGLSGQAVILIGSEVQGGFGAGATASMKLGDRVRAAVLLDAGYTPSVALTIAEAIDRVIDSCESPSGCDVSAGSAVEIENVLKVEPAVSLAVAVSRWLGVTTNASYVYLDSDAETSASNGVQLGAALDVDLKPAMGYPLGLSGQFSWTAPVGESSLQHVTDAGVGIYYTGREELAVGVQILGRRWSIQPGFADTEWSAYFTTIGLRYYW